ncbi:MAG: 16S rRNA (adenine(1518)-N(6)/adenine(1519)-N(6))-dimethyltransferase RsmA [Holosporales bacterium]|jgi:16S rRNA (adenine1518-N6/adenine1519-N6)-dimethyltransferase|nr:16S rRNA (adenine(1518)-N(6)/adenine(1519)-N(6))-dimethyltransferase RsmA [Holosporales bacterium]
MADDLKLTIAGVIKKYGLLKDKWNAKSLGQHFLCDPSLLKKIVLCALPIENLDVVEIGPGPCGLTREILKIIKDGSIYCIEKDKTLKPIYDNLIQNSSENLKFIYEDALKIKPQSLTERNIAIISNLPYNVATKLLINWLSDLSRIDSMVLMFQKEVADRICAKTSTKEYGRLSVISQLFCKTERLFDVSNTAFFPKPKVMSTVVKLIPKKEKIKNLNLLEALTASCFQHRRKTIYSILKKFYNTDVKKVLELCDIRQTSRPENISPIKFLELSERLHNARF